MSLLEQQNLLARLYLDESLRRAFLSDPAGVAGPFGLSDAEIAEIALVVPEEIDSFADSLFRKRAREIEKYLPLSRRMLGAEFDDRLRDFAERAGGQAENRFDDALEFCDFLQEEETTSSIQRDAAKLERGRLLFGSGRKSLLVLILEHDFRRNSSKDTPRRRTIYVWLRAFGRSVHRIF